MAVTNQSPSGTATADSEYSGSFLASNANDSSTGSRWVSAATFPHWLQIEWPGFKTITEVGFYAGTVGNAEHPTDYYIEHWNGSTWVEDVFVTGYGAENPTRTSHTVDFTTTKARMRMTAGNAAYAALYELEFMGIDYVPPNYMFSGYVYEQGSPVSRTVYLYDRSDGSQTAATTSSGNGYYYMETSSSGAHFIVCLDDEAGDDFNDLVLGNMMPTIIPE